MTQVSVQLSMELVLIDGYVAIDSKQEEGVRRNLTIVQTMLLRSHSKLLRYALSSDGARLKT